MKKTYPCEADARGRLGLEERNYPQSSLLIERNQAAIDTDIKPLLSEGYEGLKLAEQIRCLRLSSITKTFKGKASI